MVEERGAVESSRPFLAGSGHQILIGSWCRGCSDGRREHNNNNNLFVIINKFICNSIERINVFILAMSMLIFCVFYEPTVSEGQTR